MGESFFLFNRASWSHLASLSLSLSPSFYALSFSFHIFSFSLIIIERHKSYIDKQTNIFSASFWHLLIVCIYIYIFMGFSCGVHFVSFLLLLVKNIVDSFYNVFMKDIILILYILGRKGDGVFLNRWEYCNYTEQYHHGSVPSSSSEGW